MTTFEQALASVAINRPISQRNNAIHRESEIAAKTSLIQEAISFPGSTPKGNMIYTTIWSNGEYAVRFGKFGKEYYREKNPNVNDMAPTIFKKDEICEYDASFRAIFRLSEDLKNNGDNESLILLGCLFVRNAFLVDHKKDENGLYRYEIPEDALEFLEEKIQAHANIPIKVFLMYVDAIAWQEDVKYTTLGKKITSDVGRKNNMLTYAHFVACLLGRASYAEMLNKFSMGVSALRKTEIPDVFPELKTVY